MRGSLALAFFFVAEGLVYLGYGKRAMEAGKICQYLIRVLLLSGFLFDVHFSAGPRSAWNAWHKDGTDIPLQQEVQQRLDSLGNQEKIYGSSERRTNRLLKELRGLAGL